MVWVCSWRLPSSCRSWGCRNRLGRFGLRLQRLDSNRRITSPSAVRTALKRRMNTHGDVLLVGDGKWARKDFYSEEELVEIKKSVGGMGGRDRAAHSELTKTGMIVARKRGVGSAGP